MSLRNRFLDSIQGLIKSKTVFTDSSGSLVARDLKDADFPVTLAPTFANLTDTGLSVSSLVGTDASKMLVPITSSGDSTKFLYDGAPPAFGLIAESSLYLTNVTTGNATTGQHGFLKILPGGATLFLNGDGNFTTVTSGAAAGYGAQSFSTATSVAVTHNFNGYPLVQIIGTAISFTVTHNSVNDFTVAFDSTASGFVLYSLGSPGSPSVVTKVANYPIAAGDYLIRSNATITLTLPTAVGIAGRSYRIKRIYGSGSTTIQTTGSQAIDGQAPPLYLNSQYDAVLLISNDTNWDLV